MVSRSAYRRRLKSSLESYSTLHEGPYPQIHKNIPSVNAKLKVVKHLIRIQPLKLPQGLPTEETVSSTCLKSTGELVVQWHLKPVEQELSSAPACLLRGILRESELFKELITQAGKRGETSRDTASAQPWCTGPVKKPRATEFDFCSNMAG
ncbi:hypothetical protein A6R68_20628 [Neotoma lepida]|uniref:39S ribosomal protein L30, mitochondrial n=1 Tax=Neotoma lepida TaxID=56216 RepID=A0A1A6HSF9_NEOLE|nr:hypothetical protein A6R68_20628 [Neotoma lepida]